MSLLTEWIVFLSIIMVWWFVVRCYYKKYLSNLEHERWLKMYKNFIDKFVEHKRNLISIGIACDQAAKSLNKFGSAWKYIDKAQ